MKSVIQAAVDSGRPPLELLLDQPGRKRSRLDGILIKALYLQRAYEIEGYPIWVEESRDISFKAVPRVIRSLQAVEVAQEKAGDKAPKGQRWHAEPVLRPGAKWPTRAEWESRKAGGEVVPEEGIDALAAREAEERAKALVEANPEAQRIVAEFRERFKNKADSMGG